MVLMSGLGIGLLGAQDLKPLDDPNELPPTTKPLGVIQSVVPDHRVWLVEEPDIDWSLVDGQLKLLASPEAREQLNELYGDLWWQNPRFKTNNLLRQLALTGDKVPPSKWWIGIRVGPSEGKKGVSVIGVAPKTPAAKAELRSGDRILKLNGLDLRDLPMLHDLIQIIQNQKITLTVRNGEAMREVAITPVKRQAAKVAPPNPLGQDVPIEPVPAKPKPPNPVPVPGRPVPPRDPMRQLHQDNLETQRLLRQLIDEVKKMRK